MLGGGAGGGGGCRRGGRRDPGAAVPAGRQLGRGLQPERLAAPGLRGGREEPVGGDTHTHHTHTHTPHTRNTHTHTRNAHTTYTYTHTTYTYTHTHSNTQHVSDAAGGRVASLLLAIPLLHRSLSLGFYYCFIAAFPCGSAARPRLLVMCCAPAAVYPRRILGRSKTRIRTQELK